MLTSCVYHGENMTAFRINWCFITNPPINVPLDSFSLSLFKLRPTRQYSADIANRQRFVDAPLRRFAPKMYVLTPGNQVDD